VTLNQWRDYLQQAGIINRDGNPRQQFGRIKDKLVETGRIAIWGNLVWLVHEVSHSTDARTGPNFHNNDNRHGGKTTHVTAQLPAKKKFFRKTSHLSHPITLIPVTRHVTSHPLIRDVTV